MNWISAEQPPDKNCMCLVYANGLTYRAYYDTYKERFVFAFDIEFHGLVNQKDIEYYCSITPPKSK